jgi:hypothetical protein
VRGQALALLYFAGFTSLFFTLSILRQQGLGRSALETGLPVLPFAAASLSTAANSYRFSTPLRPQDRTGRHHRHVRRAGPAAAGRAPPWTVEHRPFGLIDFFPKVAPVIKPLVFPGGMHASPAAAVTPRMTVDTTTVMTGANVHNDVIVGGERFQGRRPVSLRVNELRVLTRRGSRLLPCLRAGPGPIPVRKAAVPFR